MKKNLSELDREYSENRKFQATADNLANGEFAVGDLNQSDRIVHLLQAWEIYLEENQMDIEKSVSEKIAECADLEELCDLLNSLSAQECDENDLSSLPTYGGDEPVNTSEIWSWDRDSLIIGDGNEYEIISREKYQELYG